MQPRFAVTGSRCFPQATSEQDLCSDRLKAVSTPHALGQLHESVQTLSVSSGVSICEVVENGIPIVLNCQGQWQESFVDIGCDLCKPSNVALQGIFFCQCLIDGVEAFFEAIGSLQAGKVLKPCFKDQGFALVQVMRASEQQEPIMHQCSALLVSEAFTNFFTDGFQAPREKLEDMEFVYHQFGVWQSFMGGIVITGPHVSTHDSDPLFGGVGQALQVGDDGGFVSVSKQVNDMVVVDISDDAAILMQQIQFINAQIELLVIWEARLNGGCELTEKDTNGTLDYSHLIGDTDKGSSQCLLLDVRHHTVSHEVIFIHAEEWLKESMTTRTTEETTAFYSDPNTLSSNGQIHKELRLFLMAMQSHMTAMDTLKRWSCQHHLEVKVMCMFIDDKNAKVSQSQEIQWHLSLCRVLPKIFSMVRVKVVTEESRVLRLFCCYPTHFRDVEIVCWSVKNGAIPRGIAISRLIGRGKTLSLCLQSLTMKF